MVGILASEFLLAVFINSSRTTNRSRYIRGWMDFYKRKPWKKRNMRFEAYIRDQAKHIGGEQMHFPEEFWTYTGERNQFPWDRKPWKRTNTWQTIRRLKILPY